MKMPQKDGRGRFVGCTNEKTAAWTLVDEYRWRDDIFDLVWLHLGGLWQKEIRNVVHPV